LCGNGRAPTLVRVVNGSQTQALKHSLGRFFLLGLFVIKGDRCQELELAGILLEGFLKRPTSAGLSGLMLEKLDLFRKACLHILGQFFWFTCHRNHFELLLVK
jgi:hypothetical protein